jgi:predicted ArsR family transcriptional regulator
MQAPTPPNHRAGRPMLDLINDRAFIEHLAPRVGLTPRTVRKHLAAVAARGYFDGQFSDWTPDDTATCQCRDCLSLEPADA